MQPSKPNPAGDVLFLVLAAAFSVVLVLTNVIGVKLFAAWPSGAALTTGIVTYPLTFLLTDVVCEIWGRKRANVMVYLGFGMSLLMLVIVQVAKLLPPHAYWVPGVDAYYSTASEYQHAFESVFSVNGKLLIGSMLAYLVAQLVDVRVYHWIRRKTGAKYMWLRNNGSTMTSQLIDTIIVNSILFYWAFGWSFGQGVEVMATIYLYKVALAAIDTPLIYLAVAVVRRILGLGPRETLIG